MFSLSHFCFQLIAACSLTFFLVRRTASRVSSARRFFSSFPSEIKLTFSPPYLVATPTSSNLSISSSLVRVPSSSPLLHLARADLSFFVRSFFVPVGGTLAEVPQNYYDRSPVHFAEKITADLLILQGLDDKVVPPGQAQVSLLVSFLILLAVRRVLELTLSASFLPLRLWSRRSRTLVGRSRRSTTVRSLSNELAEKRKSASG